jgi:uncharacterized protein YndB with AHSA1/START domain
MSLDVTLRGDRQVVLVRHLPGPPTAAFRAHVEPELIRRWMTGPGDSRMTECQHDARPGGTFRMAWDSPSDAFPPFEITGEYITLDPPHRIEHVERMHLPGFTTGDNHIVTSFTAEGEGTRMEMVMTFESREARDAALATGMTDGMEACYSALEGLAA